VRSATPPSIQPFLALNADIDPDEAIRRLRVNALASHQSSMGTGDQLVQMLQRTVAQIERSHNRIQTMSTILFVAGLIVLGAGVYETVAGRQDVWAALLGVTGGIAALATVFWTAPLDKVTASVTDLVKLETAFLGYIRVIGEIDSFFQMQYLDIIGGERDGQTKETLAHAILDTTSQMKDMMTHVITLIDDHVTGDGDAVVQLRRQAEETERRLKSLETTR
jgi:hypothetical protein